MKAPLIYKCVPTTGAAALDRGLREHYKCLGHALGLGLGVGFSGCACAGLNCNDCALYNPHGATTVGSVALKIATAETWVVSHAQAHPDQYLDLKDVLPLLKPRRGSS